MFYDSGEKPLTDVSPLPTALQSTRFSATQNIITEQQMSGEMRESFNLLSRS
jgi:hypothetical protein